jgi:hypothetical protein
LKILLTLSKDFGWEVEKEIGATVVGLPVAPDKCGYLPHPGNR